MSLDDLLMHYGDTEQAILSAETSEERDQLTNDFYTADVLQQAKYRLKSFRSTVESLQTVDPELCAKLSVLLDQIDYVIGNKFEILASEGEVLPLGKGMIDYTQFPATSRSASQKMSEE